MYAVLIAPFPQQTEIYLHNVDLHVNKYQAIPCAAEDF